MIRKANDEEKNIVISLLNKDKLQNVYLYIDSKIYGINAENISTYLLMKDDDIKCILYDYFGFLQVFQCTELLEEDIIEIKEFFEDKYNMVTGSKDLIEKISSKLGNSYVATFGQVLENREESKGGLLYSNFATDDDINEIAELICSDEGIGGHYKVSQLSEQLIDRKKNRNCVNVIIKKDDKIIAHMATYADADDISVLGGLITRTDVQGQGYGGKVLNDITRYVHSENKLPVLFCYDENIIKWYEKQGWNVVSYCGKIEKK